MSRIPQAIFLITAAGVLLLWLAPATVAGQLVVPFNSQFQAGIADTVFDLGTNSFPIPFPDPLARLEARVAVTDQNGDGAVLTGLGTFGNVIEVLYNGNLLFAGIIPQVSAPPGGTTVLSDAYPLSGYAPFPEPPQTISLEIHFLLTAYDSGTISGTLTIIPEPTSGLLLVLAGLASLRRR